MRAATRHRGWLTLVLVSVAFALALPAGAAESASTLAAIEEGWKRQEASSQMLELRWTEDLVIAKGSLSELFSKLPGSGAKRSDNGTLVPPVDSRFKVEGYARLKHQMAETERNPPQWDLDNLKFTPTVRRAMLDQEGYRTFSPIGGGGNTYPYAGVDSRKVFKAADDPWYRPVFLPLRPLGSAFRRFALDELTVVDQSAKVNGVRCVEVQYRVGGRILPSGTFWLDPERNFIPIRFTVHRQGKVGQQVNITPA